LSLPTDSYIAELHSASGSGKLLERDLQCTLHGTLPPSPSFLSFSTCRGKPGMGQTIVAHFYSSKSGQSFWKMLLLRTTEWLTALLQFLMVWSQA